MSFLKCSACPFELEKRYDTSQLQDHIGADHLGGFYLFQCPACSKSFNSAYRGYAHMKLKCKVDPHTDPSHYMEPLLLQDGQKLKEMNKLMNDSIHNYAQEIVTVKGSKVGCTVAAPESVKSATTPKKQQKAKEPRPVPPPPLPPSNKKERGQLENSRDVSSEMGDKEPLPPPPPPSKKVAGTDQVEKPRGDPLTDASSDVGDSEPLTPLPPPPPINDNNKEELQEQLGQEYLDSSFEGIVSSDFGSEGVYTGFGTPCPEEQGEPRKRDVVLPPTIDGELYDDEISGVSARSNLTMDSDVFYPDPSTPYHGVVLTSPGKTSKYNVADTLYLIDKNFGHSMSCYRNRMPGCCPETCDWIAEVSRLITQEDGFYLDALKFYKPEARKIQVALGFF